MSWSYHWPLLRGAALSLMPRGVWVFGGFFEFLVFGTLYGVFRILMWFYLVLFDLI